MSAQTVNRREFVRGLLAAASAGPLVERTAQAGPGPFAELPPGTERVALSLRMLARQAAAADRPDRFLSKQVETLGGISYLEGYTLDERGPGDVVLFGHRSLARPALHLDDLVANVRSIAEHRGYPRCSLDPRPAGIRAIQAALAGEPTALAAAQIPALVDRLAKALGPQQVVVEGVPRNSRHAHVMVDADYHMKKVSQGHVKLPDVDSYLQIACGGHGAAVSAGLTMSRFWFRLAPGAPQLEQDEGIVALTNAAVRVLTEKQQADAAGQLHDVGQDDPAAVAFAQQMSGRFSSLTSRVPAYAELENLFRLRALLLGMAQRGVLQAAGMSLDRFLPSYAYRAERPMPAALPGLANHAISGSRVAVVCGGVSMQMQVTRASFHPAAGDWLFDLRRRIIFTRPSADALAWVVDRRK
ncbi:MAG TPA: DUF1598 domain-containing protein [Planctomycetes bacterium]|nr:DUF1598 domain-containing protein [Planctomycetota bacterium]